MKFSELRKLFNLSILLLVLLIGSAGAADSETRVQAVGAIGMTVSDMDRSVEFYSKVLSFEKVSDVEVWGDEWERLQGIFGLRMRIVVMKLGEEFVELTEYLVPRGRQIPPDSRSNDLWFQHIAIVVRDMTEAYERLRSHKTTYASTAPQKLPEWNKNAAGIEAFYFKDPDGHNLEIIRFPKGKGDPKWQEGGGKLFLGIDHTAIAVSDTDASLNFYRGALGMEVAGGSENYGTEQEHLNNVFGARVRITTLRAPSGPGVEFLEYIAPTDGRPLPPDARANDIMHWQTTLIVDNAERAARELREKKYGFISADAVALDKGRSGFKRGFLVRDPDGHAMRVVER